MARAECGSGAGEAGDWIVVLIKRLPAYLWVEPAGSDTLAAQRALAERRHPVAVELLRYAYAPAEAAEDVLFKLAEADPHFYFEHEWRNSVIARGTASSARRLIDLVASGALDGKTIGTLSTSLAGCSRSTPICVDTFIRQEQTLGGSLLDFAKTWHIRLARLARIA